MIAAIDARTRIEQKGSQRLLLTVLSGFVLLTSGCINISTRTQPEDTSVKEVLKGDDCVVIVLGFGVGTATIERAKAEGRFIEEQSSGGFKPRRKLPITKVRRVEFTDRGFLFGGSRCIEVTGE